MAGTTQWSGRVEIFHAGLWGTVRAAPAQRGASGPRLQWSSAPLPCLPSLTTCRCATTTGDRKRPRSCAASSATRAAAPCSGETSTRTSSARAPARSGSMTSIARTPRLLQAQTSVLLSHDAAPLAVDAFGPPCRGRAERMGLSTRSRRAGTPGGASRTVLTTRTPASSAPRPSPTRRRPSRRRAHRTHRTAARTSGSATTRACRASRTARQSPTRAAASATRST